MMVAPGGSTNGVQATNVAASDPELRALQADSDFAPLASLMSNDFGKVKTIRDRIKQKLDDLVKGNGGKLPANASEILVPALLDVARTVLTEMGYGWAFNLFEGPVRAIIAKLIKQKAAEPPPPPVQPTGPGDDGSSANGSGSGNAPVRFRVTGGYLEVAPVSGGGQSSGGGDGQSGQGGGSNSSNRDSLTPDDPGITPANPPR
jgi:hypothetical protein